MPMFEFVCNRCGQSFEKLVRSAASVGEVICPTCGGREVKKKISTFASKVSGASSHSFNLSPGSSCNTGGT